MATEYVTYYDKYGNKRSFPKPDNWENRNKEEGKKKKPKLTDEELKKEIGNDVTILQKYAKEEGILPSELQDRLGITDRDLGFEDEYTKEFERDMQEKARYVMAEEAKKSPKTPSQDNTTSKKEFLDTYEMNDAEYESFAKKVIDEKSKGYPYNKISLWPNKEGKYNPETDKWEFIGMKGIPGGQQSTRIEVDRDGNIYEDGNLAYDNTAKTMSGKYDYKITPSDNAKISTTRSKPDQDKIDNSYFNTYKKDQERLDNVINKMNKPVEKEEDTFEYYEHDMNLAKQAYKSSMGDKKEFLRKMRQDYNWDNEDAKKYYDKVNNDRENALSGVPNANNPAYSKERLESIKNALNDGSLTQEQENNALKDFRKISGGKRPDEVYNIEDGKYTTKKTSNVGKTIAEANKAYKDNKPIIDSNKKTNDYMNDKIRNDANKTRSAKTAKTMGNELRKKNGPVGLNDAKNYMELDGSSFVVNYRDARGYTSGYMSNSGDNGNGISVRSGQINSLEKYLRENGYERKKSGYSEYVFTWEKPKKSKSQVAKEQLEKYKDNLKDPTKSKVTKADMLKRIFKK